LNSATEAQPDPYHLLRVLEDVSNEHAEVVRALEKALRRLDIDSSDEGLKALVARYLRRLRILRKRVESALASGAVNLADVEQEVRSNIATLSEYMIIVGYAYEEEVIKKAINLAERAPALLPGEAERLRSDLRAIRRLSETFQEIVASYY